MEKIRCLTDFSLQLFYNQVYVISQQLEYRQGKRTALDFDYRRLAGLFSGFGRHSGSFGEKPVLKMTEEF